MLAHVPLGCVEPAVPGATLEEKLRELESRAMWLELANDGKRKLDDIIDALSSHRTSIASVQAYRLHDLNMLSRQEEERKAAVRHAEETIRMAAAIGAENVVTTIVYGEPSVENPQKKCVEVFRKLGRLGEELSVTVSIEPLGRDRTTFLPGVADVRSLIRDVGSKNVCLMADTMHVHDNGDDIVEVVGEYIEEISELQLRDTGSRPPGRGSIDFVSVLRMARRRFKGLLCLEYQPGPDPMADFNHACMFVSGVISAAR